MLLVRNRLKKLKKTIEDEDVLNYLKYSHLDFFNEPNRKTGIDKSTQFPETRNQSTQTTDTAEKGVDTFDDLNPMSGNYILHTEDKNFDNNEKMVQATSVRVNQNDSSPPDSGDNNDEGFLSKNVRRGLRFAEIALQSAIVGTNIAVNAGNTAINIADTISDLISAPHQSSSEDEENNPEVISVNSSQPQTINSSQPQTINSSSSSSAPTPTSLPAPTSPQSTPASSAKTTPRKKSK